MSSLNSNRSSSSSSTDAAEARMTMAEALKIAGWPSSLLTKSKEPWIIDDPRIFTELLLYGSHIDRIIVLRDGVEKLGLDSAVPANVRSAAEGETCTRRFLEKLGDDAALRELRGRVYCTPPNSRDERELKMRPERRRGPGSTGSGKLRVQVGHGVKVAASGL